MTRRERLLIIAVAMLVVAFVGFWAAGRISDAFSSRQDQVARLEEEIRQKQFTQVRGKRAAQQLARFEEQALPADRERARSMYQGWLLEAVEAVDLEDVKVDPVGGRPVGDVYFVQPFNVSGRGNLEQLVNFLYDFYSADFLHRIERLSITPIKDTKLLDIALTVESVSLPGSTNIDRLPDRPSERLALKSLEEYRDPILKRNLFGPPNSSPRLESIGRREAEVNKPTEFRLRARDVDEKDRLRYWLEADERLQAKIDEATGTVAITPTELGEFTVKIGVADNGLPEGSDEATFTIQVVEPPPPMVVVKEPDPPAFDDAGFAYITGVVEINGRPEIWLSVRTTGQLLKLREGDRIQVGQFDGVVKRIHSKAIQIQQGDRQLYLKNGQNLTQAVELKTDDI